MMAVSLPTSGLNNMDIDTSVDNEVLCIFGSEDCFRSISKENMDQIRNTMMRHETLFKEQVQTLHKLYDKQKLAMLEIKKVICSHAQVLPFSSDSISDQESQLHNFVEEGKSLRQASATSQAYMEESHVLSLHSIRAVKEFTGYDPKMSSFIHNAEVKTLPSALKKLRKEIDLERLPEDYMDEFENQNEPNSYEIRDAKTCLSEEGRETFQVSCVGSNLSVLQVESPSLNQRDQRSDITALLEPQGISECYERASETKSREINAKDNKLKDHPCNHLPTAANSIVYEESNQLFTEHAEKPLWLPKGSSQNSIEHKELHMGTTHAQAKGSNTSASTQVYQSLDSNHSVMSHLKLDEKQLNNSADGGSVSTNPAICPQSSSTLKNCDSKSLNNLCAQGSPSLETESVLGKQNLNSWAITYQTSEDGGNEDPNSSGHGSNSMESHNGNVCKDGNLSIFTINNDPKFGDNVSEAVVVTESSENPENISTLEEACESIAAKILLSFAPHRSQDHAKVEGCENQIEVESNIASRDVTKRALCERRSMNYNDEGFTNETIKWTKSVQGRRRTSRRPR